MKMSSFIIIATVFVWVGCLAAISFMESWLKFQAPGITVPLGLGIGRLVFGALNKMEWAFTLIIAASLFFGAVKHPPSALLWYAVPVFILLLQTFWMLPALDLRAQAVLNGQTGPPSLLHWYYAGGEVIKIISLFLLGFGIFKLYWQ